MRVCVLIRCEVGRVGFSLANRHRRFVLIFQFEPKLDIHIFGCSTLHHSTLTEKGLDDILDLIILVQNMNVMIHVLLTERERERESVSFNDQRWCF